MTASAIHKPAFAVSRWFSALAAFVGALAASPIVIIHFCSAGSRVFELVQGFIVSLVAGFVAARLQTPTKRLLAALLASVASLGLTLLYFAWIHSSFSPWPAIEPPEFALTPE